MVRQNLLVRNGKVVDGFVRRMLVPALVCLGAASWSAGAHATKIGLIGADTDTGVVRSYLLGTGMFNEVTRIPENSSLAALSAYDALLVWSNFQFADAKVLGDTLAKYVDTGGGVVLATFSYFANFAIGGEIATEKYSPFSLPVSSLYSPATLGEHDPGSPIMAGVSDLTGYFRDAVSLNSDATFVANWSDGSPLAAWNDGGNVVGIALYPGEVTLDGLSGDYARLFANALVFAADPNATVPEPGTLALLALPLLAGLRFGRRRTSPAS
jgi:hypothetical protein